MESKPHKLLTHNNFHNYTLSLTLIIHILRVIQQLFKLQPPHKNQGCNILSKNGFWSSSLSSSKNGCRAAFYILGFVLQQVRITCFCCNKRDFHYSEQARVAQLSTPCLDSLCASFLRLFGFISLTFMEFLSCKKNTINKHKKRLQNTRKLTKLQLRISI